MPRKTKEQRQAEQAEQMLATAIETACDARPFAPEHAPDAPERFEQLPPEVQAGVAQAVFAYYELQGHSADETRVRFGGAADGGKSGGLTGPRRRKLFRDFLDGRGIARSYSSYSDGEPRSGSAHARQHGPLAAARAAEQMQALASEQASGATLADCRSGLRAASLPVPTVRKGDEGPLRAAYAALLLAQMQESSTA